MEFKKNELINETLDHSFETWSHTLDTADYVPTKFLNKIDKLLFNELKRKFKQSNIFYLLYLEEKGYKLGLFEKLKIYFSGLRPLYEGEKLVDSLQEEISNLKEELEIIRSKKQKRKSKSENEQ